MDMMKLVMSSAMQQTGITEDDVNQIKQLIQDLSEMPVKIKAIEEKVDLLNKKLDNRALDELTILED